MANHTGTIQIQWVETRQTFADRVRNTVSAKFSVPASSLYQEFMQPVERLYSQLSSRTPLLRPGETVRIEVSFSYDPRDVVARDVQLSSPDAKSTAPAQPQARSAADVPLKFPINTSGAVLISLLESASTHGWRAAVTDFVVTEAEVEIRLWKSLPDGATGQKGPAINASSAVQTFMTWMQFSKGLNPKIYTARFEVAGGVWSIKETQLIGTVEPLVTTGQPAPAEEGESFEAEDEGEMIIADIQATRRLVLNTAAELIAEQDPSRLDNILWSIAPFAIGKLGKLKKLGSLRRLKAVDILKRLRAPNAVQLPRLGRYHAEAAFNPKLTERALHLRRSKNLVEYKDFEKINVSVWHVRIDGNDHIIDLENIPMSTLDKLHPPKPGDVSVGLHSEGLIAQRLLEMEKRGVKVQVHQIYTERPPCAHCAKLLEKYSEVPVFHSLSPEKGRKAERLMRAYGIHAE